MPFIVLSNRSELKTVDGKRLDDTVLFGLGGLITKKHNKKVVECRLFQVSLLRETISFTHFSKIFKWNSCGQPLTIGIVGFIRVDREMLFYSDSGGDHSTLWQGARDHLCCETLGVSVR